MSGEAQEAGGQEARRVGVAEAHALVEAGRATPVDVRDARLYDNAHLRGAWSLPLAVIQATPGRIPAREMPPGESLLILYCA